MKDKTAPERAKRYAERMRAKGFERVQIWVHRNDKGKLQTYAQKLKRGRENAETS